MKKTKKVARKVVKGKTKETLQGGPVEAKKEDKLSPHEIFIACAATLILSIIGLYQLYDWATPDTASSRNISIELSSDEDPNPPLTVTELKALFPDYQKDWEKIQNIVGVSGLRLPEIRYSQSMFFIGAFDSSDYKIYLDREIFATTTPQYSRYVLLHEMAHAAIEFNKKYNIDEDQHCFMVKEKVFVEIGKIIRNEELGRQEQAEYAERCEPKKFQIGSASTTSPLNIMIIPPNES